MHIRTPWKRGYSYLCMWMTSNWLERNKIIIQCGKLLNKEVDLARTNIFPWSCILGMHSTSMRSKPRYCGQLQNHVRIANFCGEIREITILSKSSYFFMVLWYGGHEKKYVKRYCELSNKTTQQLYKVSAPCIDDHHFEEEEMNLLQKCQIHALKLFWNVCTWQELDDPIFYGQ